MMADPKGKLMKILQEISVKENYLLSNINTQPITSGGANYTAALYLATISQTNKPDINLFAKVSNLTEEARSVNAMLAKVYLIESVFYTELATNFERIYNNNNVPAEERVNIPKYYSHDLTPYEETLVLENLEVKRFGSFNRMKTFNWEYASTAVTQLARFHAVCLAFQEENPVEFKNITNQFDSDLLVSEEMLFFMTHSVQVGCNIVVNEEHKSRLQKYFSPADQINKIMLLMSQDRKMLVHGDFRPSNLMHRCKNGKLEVITLDYQTLMMGNPVADLMYFIFSGSDEEFRRLHYRRLQDHYFTQLTLALQNLKIDVENVYPRKTFQQDLNEMQPLGLLIGLTMTSLITVNPEDVPQVDGNPESFMLTPNELASERINGIVSDFVKWGVV